MVRNLSRVIFPSGSMVIETCLESLFLESQSSSDSSSAVLDLVISIEHPAQEIIGLEGFLNFDEVTMRKKLKEARYRFYNVRSKFLVQSRWIVDELPHIIAMKDRIGARDYLVNNLKGIGYKEASHFLRNVGVFDFSILDKHILNMIRKEHPERKFLVGSRKNYLETEKTILEFADSISLEPGILDLYLWKIATGKLLK